MNPTFFDFHLFPVPEHASPQNPVNGEGEKDVWIWYEAENGQQTAIEAFLSKVFGAAKVDLARHTRYVCLTKHEAIGFSQIPGSKEAKVVFLFGVKGDRLGLQFQIQPYHPVAFGGTTYIMVDDISEIQEERRLGKKEKAGQLWQILKSYFNV